MQQPNADLLEEFEQSVNLTPVSPGLRFVNMLVDTIALYALVFILAFFIGMMAATSASASESYDYEASTEDGGSLQLILTLLWIVFIVGYYTVFEYAAKGRTLGKLATGTVAVREDGSKLTFKDAFVRSLCRLIPFEAFSAFGYRPWHDSLSKTIVVKKTW